MVITKEIDYALKILRCVSGDEMLSTPEICRDEDLPIHFVYRILKKLDNAGFVKITRGKYGGTNLACDLSKATLLDLIEALGDRRYVSACNLESYECSYRQSHDGRCSVHEHLNIMQNELDDLLRSRTISQLFSSPVN